MAERRWIALPCEGARLVRCRISGNGKDAELRLEAVGHPVAILGTHEVTIASLGGLRQGFRALDDRDVELLIEPPPDRTIAITEARIDIAWEDRSTGVIFSEWTDRREWNAQAYYAVRLGFG
jgi:hypothetical protein